MLPEILLHHDPQLVLSRLFSGKNSMAFSMSSKFSIIPIILGIIGIIRTSNRFITLEIWQYNHFEHYELFTPHDSFEIRTIFTICIKIVFYATAFWSYNKFSRINLTTD